MARKVTFQDSTKTPEKKEYFNSKYSLKSVTGIKKPGDKAYAILLRPEEFLFQVEYHNVKAKSKGKDGFKSLYDTKILCKRYDEEGNRSEELPTCCALADQLFKEAKEKAKIEAVKLGKDPENKEVISKLTNSLITFTGTQMYIPLIILGTTETEQNAKPSLSKLAIKDRYMFAYLEMNKKAYISDFYEKLKKQLESQGDIDSDLSEEDMASEMLKNFKNRIIEINAVEPKGAVPYERSYEFIPFTNKNIAKISGEYEAIVNYEKDEALAEASNDFLNAFEVEVDNFVKDWTDDDLKKYLVDDVQRRDNVDSYMQQENEVQENEEEEEEVVTVKTPAVSSITSSKETKNAISNIMGSPSVEQVSEVSIAETDLSFDMGEEDEFIDDLD